MKFNSILMLSFCLVLFACSSSQPESEATNDSKSETQQEAPTSENDWDSFWAQFNAAVQKGDARSVAKMTVMPLRGHHHGALDAGHFASHFNDIFDAKTKSTFAAADDRNFNSITVTNPQQASAMNVAPNTEVKIIGVQYIFDEGTEKQTESSTVFNFGKIEGKYKLLSIMQAG